MSETARSTTNTLELEVDLHGYHPDDICGEARTVDEECGGALKNIIRQAWEMGRERIPVYSWTRPYPGNLAWICEYQHRLFRAASEK